MNHIYTLARLGLMLSLMFISGQNVVGQETSGNNIPDSIQEAEIDIYGLGFPMINDSIVDLSSLGVSDPAMLEGPYTETSVSIVDLDAQVHSGHPEFGMYSYDDATELIGKRDRFSKVYIREDGTYTKQQALSPMHYKDGLGNWVTYGQYLETNPSSPNEVGIYRTDLPIAIDRSTMSYKMRLDSEDEVFVGGNQYIEVFDKQFNNIETLNASFSATQFDDSTVVMDNIYPSTSKVLSANPGSVEKYYRFDEVPSFITNVDSGYVIIWEDINISPNIVLDAIMAPNQFDSSHFHLTEHYPNLTLNATPLVKNEEEIGSIQNPYVFDDISGVDYSSLDSTAISDLKNSSAMGLPHIIEELENGAYRFGIVIPIEWLKSSQRNYPVTVDPTVWNRLWQYGSVERAGWGCNEAMNVNLPANSNIQSVRTTYRINARNGAWRYEQRSRLQGPNGYSPTYVGNGYGGTHYYDYFANNTLTGTVSGNQLFRNWKYRTWTPDCTYSCGWWCSYTAPCENCGQNYQYRWDYWYVYIDYCTPQGDQVTYGTNQWIGYVYHNQNFTNYAGYVTQANDFDQGFGGSYVNYNTNGCPVYTESFSVRYRNRRYFPCGYYRFRLQGDDGHRITIPGYGTYSWWYGQGWGPNHYTPWLYLNGWYNLQLEYYEGGGGNRITINTETLTPTYSVTINQGASGAICTGTSTTLTATGSTNIGSLSYSWSGPGGYSASGASATGVSTAGTYTVTATHTCGGTTTDTYVLTTHTPPTAPTGISGTTSLCGGGSTTLTATGGTNGSGATYQWYAGGCGSGGVLGTGSSITVSPSSTTTYYVRRVASGANACTNTTGCASQIVTINTQPVANAGVDQSQCNTNAYTISTASITGSGTLNNWTYVVNSGTATVTNTGTLNGPTITPTQAAGQVTMTLNVNGTSPCSNTSDVMVMTWSASPTASAGPDILQCGTATSMFTGSSASTGSTVSWAVLAGGSGTGNLVVGNSTDPTTWGFTPTSASGTKTIRLTAVPPSACPGSNITDDLTFTWDEAPSVSTTSPQNSCTGLNPFTISGASASGSGTLSWNLTPVSGTASITAGGTTVSPTFDPTTTSGQYSLQLVSTGTGGCVGNNDASIMTVNWEDPPTANAGSDVSLCEGATATMTGSSVGGGGFSSISWTQTGGTATGSFTTTHPTDPTAWVYTPTSTGTAILQLQVTGSGAICGSTVVSDSRTITWDALPTVDAGSDIDGCTASSPITMAGASASNYSSYTWSGGDPTFGSWNQGGSITAATFTPLAADGQISATLTVNGNGACSGESVFDFRLVDWHSLPVVDSVYVTANTDCQNPNGVILVYASQGLSPYTYSNDGGTTYQNDLNFDLLNSGNYNVYVQDANNCSSAYASNPVNVGGPSTPNFSYTVSDALCNGTESGTITVTVNSGGVAWFDQWVESEQKLYRDTTDAYGETATYSVAAGDYMIRVYDRFGCVDSLNSAITVGEPTPIVPTTTVVNNTNCTGTDGSISISASGGTPSYQYSFNGGAFSTTSSFTNLGTGDYPIIVRDANGCELPFEESIGGPFVANAGIDRYLCAGSSLQLNGQLDVNGITSAASGGNYSQSSISYNPRTPGAWSTVSLGDDAVSGWVNMPFSLTFFGNSFNRFRISSNGFITFNDDVNSYCCSGSTIPNGAGAENMVALCWEDLNPTLGGTIRHGVYGSSPNRVYVIEFNNIQHFGGGNAVTGQILLFESTNNIEIHNTSVNADGGTNTMGIENATATSGVQTHAGANWSEVNTGYLYQPPYNLGTINYTWSPSTGLNNTSIVNPTVSGISADQTYTLQVEIVGICTLEDDVTVYVSDLSSETSGTYGTAPNISTAQDVICNGDDDGCISVSPATGQGPYLIQGPSGEIGVYGGRMKELTVSNATGSALSDYQVKMTVAYAGAMRSDFGDLRFYDGTTGNLGQSLNYYVESYTLSTSATVYVKVPSVPAGGTTLYMLYGNSTLTSQSDPDNTLLLYEDMMSTPSGTTYGNASYIDHQFVRLTQAINSTNGQLDYNLNPSTGGNGYVADFEFWIGGGNGADAIYQYSDCASRPTWEDAATGGYTFAYDTWQDQHQVKYNGTTVAANAESGFDNSTWRTGKIEQFNTTGRMYLDGTLRVTGTVTADNAGNAFGFGARTGGANNEHRVRNIRVRKLVSPEPTVTFGTEELSNNYFCDLAPGSYSVRVWDAADCDVTEASITIGEPTALSIDNIDISDTWCYVANVGELDITVSGGTQASPPPPYAYNWAGPSGFSSTNEDLTGLYAGVYNVTVADDNGCTESSTATVGQLVPLNPPSFTWKGSTDQLWQEVTNWDCGLPDATSEVIIPGTPVGGNTPIIQNGVIGEVLNIDVQGNTPGLLEIQNGGLLKIFEP